MMKIKVLMIDIGGWGGITHYTYNLMQALAAHSEIECVLLTDQAYEMDGLPRDFKVIKRAFHGQPYMTFFVSVCKAVFACKPGIIHVQTMLTARKDWVLFLLARLAGARIIFTAHNVMPHEDAENQAFFMKTAFRFIYSSSRRIIAHSNFTRDAIMRIFGVAGGKISVIPHGNYAFFRTLEIPRDEARRQLNISPDKKVVLHFGALRHYKGIESLLQAMKLLCKRHSDVLLLLAGRPMNVPQGYFRQAIAQQGLDASVMFIEKYIPAQEIPAIFFASDLVVLPYTHIDTSGSIQLAYGFSKPVVATRTGSMPEVVEHGVNGLLVEPGDPQALADAIEQILFEAAALDRMGAASFVLAKEKFSWQSIAKKTCQVYREVVT
jgi:D-inositol-3-phosphate glycosyltransferase